MRQLPRFSFLAGNPLCPPVDAALIEASRLEREAREAACLSLPPTAEVLFVEGRQLPRAVTSAARRCVLLYVCVLILLYVCPLLLHVCPHTAVYVSSYCYVCVLILLYMCPHTASCVSSGAMCVLFPTMYVSVLHILPHVVCPLEV
jgi:hypothetical protein